MVALNLFQEILTMFALFKLITLAALAIFGMLSYVGYVTGLFGDEYTHTIVSMIFVYFTYVFKASIAIPYVYHRYLQKKLDPRLGDPILVMIIFLWVWFIMFVPLYFVLGSFVLGYILFLIASLQKIDHNEGVRRRNTQRLNHVREVARQARAAAETAGDSLPFVGRTTRLTMPGGLDSVGTSLPNPSIVTEEPALEQEI